LYGSISDAVACVKKIFKERLFDLYARASHIRTVSGRRNNSAMGVVIMPNKNMADRLEQLLDLYQAVRSHAIN
jgi:hypothetical protein